MLDQVMQSGSWLLGSGWGVPLIGIFAFGLALLVGRLITPGAKPAEQPDLSTNDFLKGISQDRRAAPRRNGTTVELELMVGQDETLMPAWILNRSIGGLGILCDKPLQVGAHIKIRSTTNQGIRSWVDLTVRSCRRKGTQYEIGCQFHRIPDWNQMLQFG